MNTLIAQAAARTAAASVQLPAPPSVVPAPETHTITFFAEKPTKNTVKFAEEPRPGQPPIVGTLYVQKWFVGTAQKLTVTVTKS